MDAVKAKELERKLAGSPIGQWTIESLIDHGKSAAVFRGIGEDGPAAVKIFDDELIKRYGDETQFARIERERELVGKAHPNLVKILGGGFEPKTSNHFIVMEYLHGPNLKQCLQAVPVEKIGLFVAQLAAAARFLEDLGYCHRDIKPENIIMVEDLGRLVLLDLGVLRPLSGSDLTDADGVHPFVGTLQYSSPEFLLRKEEDSAEGWRALTFYQMGGVLHDLIMRRPLFSEFAEPYARLVNAVQHETPQIQNSAVPFRLVDLARSCLLKDWRTRLKLVTWDTFAEPAASMSAVGSAKQRVTTRGAIAQARMKEGEAAAPQDEAREKARFVRDLLENLCASARAIRSENAVVPPLKILMHTTPDECGFGVQFCKAMDFGLGRDLTVLIHVELFDLEGRVVCISARGCLGPFQRADIPEGSGTTIFQGVYDAVATEEALENCVYDLLDQAQRNGEEADPATSVWLAPGKNGP